MRIGDFPCSGRLSFLQELLTYSLHLGADTRLQLRLCHVMWNGRQSIRSEHATLDVPVLNNQLMEAHIVSDVVLWPEAATIRSKRRRKVLAQDTLMILCYNTASGIRNGKC